MTATPDRPSIDELRELLRDAEGDRDSWAHEAKRTEAEVEQLQTQRHTYQRAWHSAKDRARKQRTRAERAEATLTAVRDELHALNSEVRLNPIALAGRRDAVARIRAVLEQHGQTPA
ncbi:hypothetical protein [Streptomyces sp. NPDC004330]|uniref:hypothetical protein n=1 Tax=Streptomyces sp. NPDC004330 TaxID=3364700 RepID=UPI0036D161A8